MKQFFFYYLLITLLLMLSLSGLGGGSLLILKIDGSLLGMENSWLVNSPFDNYLIPGMVLFLSQGLLPLFTLIGLIFKPDWKWPNTLNLYDNRHWSWTFAIYSGIVSMIWIIVQQMMTQYFWLQTIVLSMGLFILMLSLTPVMMKKYENS